MLDFLKVNINPDKKHSYVTRQHEQHIQIYVVMET